MSKFCEYQTRVASSVEHLPYFLQYPQLCHTQFQLLEDDGVMIMLEMNAKIYEAQKW